MPALREDLPDELRRLVQVTPAGCWALDVRWNSGNGYKKKRWRGRAWMAHRLTYELLVGPVCVAVHLDHRCRHRWCVNPDHLAPELPVRNTRLGNAVLYRPAAT